MKLTKDLLIRFAKTHVAERLQKKPRPLCIYLTGSVCTEDFLLGGCTDIDLVCIHNIQPAVERELMEYLNIFYEYSPKSIGGKLPPRNIIYQP